MDDDVELQAIAWHDRLRDGGSAATRTAFEVWRAADPRHGKAFDQQARFTATAQTGGWHGVMPAPRARRSGRTLGFGLAGIAAAAVALVLVVPQGGSIVAPPRVAGARASTLSQARRLADGSLVALADGSVIATDTVGGGRGARLVHGTARFYVVHDPAHPFRVVADGVIVTARGTVFEVALTPGDLRVSLLEGRIEVIRPGLTTAPHPIVLQPGEALSDGDDAPTAMASRPSPITWLEVDGMTLGDVITLAARDGGAHLALADPALAALRVTGRFDLSKPAGLAAKLAAALDLRVAARGDVLVLSRAK